MIYETRSEKKYDKILLAYCNEKVQRERVITRDKISNSLFEKIIASQLSFKEKMKFKPLVINTSNKTYMTICVFLLLIKTLMKVRLENGKKKVNT